MITQIILGGLAFVCVIVATILNVVNMNKQSDKDRKRELLASTVLMAIGFVLLAIAMVVSMISVTAHTISAAGDAAQKAAPVVQQAGQMMADNPEILAALA